MNMWCMVCAVIGHTHMPKWLIEFDRSVQNWVGIKGGKTLCLGHDHKNLEASENPTLLQLLAETPR